MQNFIVLGLIPGTNIQFGFTAWLLGCTALLFGCWLFHERRQLYTFMVSWYVARLIRQHRLA